MADSVELERRVEKLTAILEVAKAMAVQRDLDRLLALILDAATRAVDADRSSLFIVDRDRNEVWTKIAQGTSEIRIPLSSGIAGYVATTGEAVNIPEAYADPRFHRDVDQGTGYRTHSILCVPMHAATEQMTGVLQALNKRHGTFTAEDEEVLAVLGGQAASSIENALLHEEISLLFEGFVSASVLAIESRDPSTAGHSSRVAAMTVALAQAIEQVEVGRYARVRFSPEEINEIRYASLLHDFGKVGVREPVLVKAEKLYPHEIEALRARFELARARLEVDSTKRQLELVARAGAEAVADALAAEREAFARSCRELDEMLDFALSCSRPSALPSGGFDRLGQIRARTFPDGRGGTVHMLSEKEVRILAIPTGSLSDAEREEVQSHVTWTYRFLSQIPWTRSLRAVPDIAYAHHESLDGKGYPRKLAANEIPIQSRMISLADIFDALTASDRPYKKALGIDRALDVLRREAETGRLDRDLYEIFLGARIWERVAGR